LDNKNNDPQSAKESDVCDVFVLAILGIERGVNENNKKMNFQFEAAKKGKKFWNAEKILCFNLDQ
jgi:hypothetical protein